jgi:thioredoxin-dependent peroxiredoxin
MRRAVSCGFGRPRGDTGSLHLMKNDQITLEPGMRAPDFSAPDQTGRERTLEEFRGSKLVMYFYPKAFTPGCTTESCDFRDRHDLLEKAGYIVVGVSPDRPDKLEDFRRTYDLPFDLLSDPDHVIAEAYGAWGTKKNYGREYQGIIRSTFLIDGEGFIAEAMYNVKAKGHAERITSSVAS